MKKLFTLLTSILFIMNLNAQGLDVGDDIDVFEFDDFLMADADYRKMAMAGQKLKIQQKLRADIIAMASKRVSESNLIAPVAFPVIQSYIKASQGLDVAVGAMTPLISFAAVANSALTDGLTTRGTKLAATRLIIDSIFFSLSLSTTFALPMISVAVVDYALSNYVADVQKDYEKYWLSAYDWYFFKKLQIKYSKFHELTDVSRYVLGAQSSAVKTMKPWNTPDFVRFTDQFWDDSSIIAQEYNTLFPSVLSMFINADPAYQMNREKFRAHFYETRLHAPMRVINERLVLKQHDLIIEEAREIYRQLVQEYLDHFANLPPDGSLPADDDPQDDIIDGNDDDDISPYTGYAIAQATSPKRPEPHYFVVDVAQSGIEGQVPNTDLRRYGFCTGNAFQEMMDYSLVTAIYPTETEAIKAITVDLTDARITGLGCRYYRAMEFGMTVHISDTIFRYIRNNP